MTLTKEAAREHLRYVLGRVSDVLAERYPEVKTVAYYQRALDQNVRDLYSGKMDREGFINDLMRLVDEQFTRAWNEGMRSLGLDPASDQEPEWQDVLDKAKLDELNFIEGYADDILSAVYNGQGIEPLRARVTLWANRYNEIVSLAVLTCGRGKLKWQLGATEQHCETCAKLNGCVDYAENWDASGYHPQGAPNDLLECGGWRCDCSLVPTTERRTRGGIAGRMG